MGHPGIADPLLGVGVGQTHTLDHGVQPVHRGHGRQVVARGQLHGQDGGQALAIGRTFVQRHAPIVGGDGIVPGGDMGGHIRRGDPAAVALDVLAQFVGEVAFVDEVFALGGHAPQGLGQGGDAHEFAGPGRVAVDEQFVAAGLFGTVVQVAALPVGGAQQLLHLGGPARGDDLRDRIAVLRRPDGGLEHVRQGHAPVPLQQIAPPGHGAGHADRLAGVGGHLLIARVPHGLNGRAGWRSPGTVEGGDTFLLGVPIEGKAVAADAGGGGFHHIEHGRGGDGRVRGVAPGLEHVQSGLGCQGLAGGHHAPGGQDIAAPGSPDPIHSQQGSRCGISDHQVVNRAFRVVGCGWGCMG